MKRLGAKAGASATGHKVIAVNVPVNLLGVMDKICSLGTFCPSRSELVRMALVHFLMDEIPRLEAGIYRQQLFPPDMRMYRLPTEKRLQAPREVLT